MVRLRTSITPTSSSGISRRPVVTCWKLVAAPARSPNVLALDLSPEMIRIARERSTEFPNIEFERADIRDQVLPAESFDCIATIATLHHLPFREILLKMKAALRTGGVLLVLDLFEPERNLFKPEGLLDAGLNVLAMGMSVTLRLTHQGRLLPRREVRDAWAEHLRRDIYPTMSQVRELCAEILPGAKVRKHLLWRYSIIWNKTALPLVALRDE